MIKTIKYDSYHELAYLHPNHFIPNELIASKYVNIKEPLFIIRLARLSAHHDHGIRGIDNNLLHLIINLLSKYGRVYITNERKIGNEFDKYIINIDPIDIHHIIDFANLYIGDSQTMAAESGATRHTIH